MIQRKWRKNKKPENMTKKTDVWSNVPKMTQIKRTYSTKMTKKTQKCRNKSN